MKFILTKELGRLAKWLRILGYDSKFYDQDNLSTLVIIALREQRAILTRNSRMRRFLGPRMLKVDSDFVEQQIKQVLSQCKLKPNPGAMFTRCTICNVQLKQSPKSAVKNKVPPYVYQTQEKFMLCPQCKRVYWQGTHWGNVRKFLTRTN